MTTPASDLFTTIRAWRRKFRKRRKAIVTVRLPAEKELASLSLQAVTIATKKGLVGEEAREFAVKSVAKNIEDAIKGNTEHPLGRFIEVLDDVLGLAIEVAYQGISARKANS